MLRKINLIILLFFISLFITACMHNENENEPINELSIYSPDEKIKVDFYVNSDGTPTYELFYNEQSIIKPSTLGFTFKNNLPLKNNFEIIECEINEVNDTWQPVWGNKSEIINHYKEIIIHLGEINVDTPRKMDIIFRLYNDGLGFRYVLPEQEHLSKIEIMSENTEFRFTDNHTSWWIPNDWDSYEYTYNETPLISVEEVSTPFTMRTKEGVHLTIHEAQLVDYAGMALKKIPMSPYSFKSELAPWPDGVKVKGNAPLKTPWRTIQIGDDAGDLVTSDLILNLNDPCEIEDTSWIQPMKYVGIWWEMHVKKSTWESGSNHGATTENAKRYIDFAAQYLDTEKEPIGLLVEGWNIGWDGNWMDNGNLFDFTTPYPDFNLEEVVQYAKENNVEYIMHNETSGDIINYESQMDDAYDLYERLGIHAIKSGYVSDNGMHSPMGQHHHGQYMVNHYYNAVKDAALHKIMINTHEPIKGTGLYRTYPNWIAREGVQGMEYNAWSAGNPPDHTTILPFTRMMAGPIDYTPGIFNVEIDEQPNYRVHTTRAKQLALYVTISSPLQMVTDLPENYFDETKTIYPEFKFIKDVPVTWDQILVPHAKIGDYISIARKSGDEWYIGTITDEHARDLEITLDFLDPDKKYVAEIYSDSHDTNWETNPNNVSIEKVIVQSEDTLIASLATSGGQAVRLYPASNEEINTLEDYTEPEVILSYKNTTQTVKSNEAFMVSVLVENTGSVIKGKHIELYLNEEKIDSKYIRVNPHSTKEVVFYSSLFTPDLYKIKVNNLDDLNLYVIEKEATFIYSDLEVTHTDNNLTAKATITNLGTYGSSTNVGLYINGELIEEKALHLNSKSGGYSEEITFNYSIPSEGVYEVSIGSLEPKIVSYPLVKLDGSWLFQKGDNPLYKEISYDDSNWQQVTLPSSWESHSNYYDDFVFAWYRKSVYIPSEWEGYSLKITLGKIDDCDQTFFNGVLIGESGTIPNEQSEMISAWEEVREYIVPKEIIQYGENNLISIRVYDATVGGGVYDGPIKSIELIKD